jgi:HAD superfamily hydrolase (TIGR01458 family)
MLGCVKPEGLLLDLNGVFYEGNQVLPGAPEFLQFIEKSKIPALFLTNTSTARPETLAKQLLSMGLPISADKIYSPAGAALAFLKDRPQARLHLLLSEDMKKEFKNFEQSHANPDYIVIGDIGERWNYAILNQTFEMLIFGAEILALHKGRYWQTENKLRLDIGAFVAGLEYASGKDAIVLGKPSAAFYAGALARLGLGAHQVLMVGDDIHSDIAGAHQAGIGGCLVKSGKYRDNLVKLSGIVPDCTIDSIADLPALL